MTVWLLLKQPRSVLCYPEGFGAACGAGRGASVCEFLLSSRTLTPKRPVNRAACESTLDRLRGEPGRSVARGFGDQRRADAPGVLRAGAGGLARAQSGAAPAKVGAEAAPGGGGAHTGHVGATRHRGKSGVPGPLAKARGLGSVRGAATGARWGGEVCGGGEAARSRRGWREPRVLGGSVTAARRRHPPTS